MALIGADVFCAGCAVTAAGVAGATLPIAAAGLATALGALGAVPPFACAKIVGADPTTIHTTNTTVR